MDSLIAWLILGLIVTGVIGMFLGGTVNKYAAGFWLGLLLGPIGWIIVFLLPRDETPAQQATVALKTVDTVTNESSFQRDLSSDGYKIWLVKKYSIERNDVLSQFVCQNRLFPTVEEALAFADSIEQSERVEKTGDEENPIDQEILSDLGNSDQRHGNVIIALGVFLVIAIFVAFFAVRSNAPEPGPDMSPRQYYASTSANIGDHIVYFSAQSTDELPPEIAKAYNILRSKNRAMLNVSVIRKADKVPVAAVVSVKTVNLTGQLKNVSMRQIKEQEAIYYIGETAVANRETLIFDIGVTPEGSEQAKSVRFKRTFYTK